MQNPIYSAAKVMSEIITYFYDLYGNMDRWYIYGLAVYLIWFIYSDHFKSLPADALPIFPCRLFFGFWSRVWRFLGITLSVVWDGGKALDPKKKYMITCTPHGAFAFSGAMYLAPQVQLGLIPELKGVKVFNGVASVLFYLPIIREIMLFIGCREITGPTIRKIVKTTASSMALVPGGMQCQLNTRHDEERMYCQKNLGFIRIAIELGMDLMPMYGFGENQLLTMHTYGHGFRTWLLKKFQVGLPLCTGRYGVLPIPHSVHMTHVYGRPIKTKQNPNPTEADISRVFEALKAEYMRIWDTHAGHYLPADVVKRGLQIIRIGVDYDDRNPDPDCLTETEAETEAEAEQCVKGVSSWDAGDDKLMKEQGSKSSGRSQSQSQSHSSNGNKNKKSKG